MGLMAERDPRFANLERRVGIFLFTSALIVVAAVGVVGYRQDLFTPKTAVVFHDDSGRDLVEGMEVHTRGFRIGKVRRVRLDEDGKVEVTLAIKSALFKWVRRDSEARIAAKAFIGDSRIEISPGSPQAPALEPGGTIVFVRDPDLTDVAKKVMEDVKPVLLEIKSLIEYVSDPQGDVKRTIANVNQLSAGLVETRGKLDETLEQVGARVNAMAGNLEALSSSVNGEVLPKVKGLVDDAGRTTRSLDAFVREDLRGLTSSLQQELIPQVRALLADAGRAAAAAGDGAERVNAALPALLEKVDAGLVKVNASLENVRAVTEELVPAAKEATGVLRQGGELVEETQALVRRTGELWPFRTGSKKPGTTVDVDSYQLESRPDAGGAPGAGAR